jgi:hypothetical protein
MIPRPQWSRHRFDEVTNETKTNLSMYIPMIEAGMHQHLQLAPYDPQRVLPNPPAELQHLGMSAPIEPIYKVSGAFTAVSRWNSRLALFEL